MVFEEPEVNAVPENPEAVGDNSHAVPTPQKGIFRDVVKLVFGTGTGQVILALTAPIIARLYTPDANGISSVFFSLVSVISIVICLRYELAIPLASSEEEAANLLAVSLGSTVIISAISGLFLWVLGPAFCVWINAPALQPYLWLVPVNLFANGFLLAVNYWNTRSRKFSRLAIAQVTNAVITVLAQILLGLRPGAGAGEMVIGYIIGTLAAVVVLFIQMWREDQRLFLGAWNLKIIGQEIKRYRKFPILSSWAALLNTVSWQLPTFMLTQSFSPTISGYYSLGNKVLRFPMSIIGGSIGQAQYPHLKKAKEDGSIHMIFEESLNRLLGFSFIPLLTFSFVSKEVFVFVFGSQWAEAGVYTQILCLWMIVWFISGPLSNIFFALEKQDTVLIIQIVILASRFLSLWIGGLTGDPRLSIILFAVSGIIVYGYLCFAQLSLADVPLRKTLAILWKYVRIVIPIIFVMLALKMLAINEIVQVIVACAIIAGYFVYIFTYDQALRNQLIQVLKMPMITKFIVKRK